MRKHFLRILLVVSLFWIGTGIVWAQPPNDNPCSATYLPYGVNQPGYNNGASYGAGEPAVPACFDASPYNTVWYYFQAPASGCITIKTSGGTNADTQIGLYGGACGSLSLVSGTNCNDNVSSCSGYNYYFSYLQASGLTPGQNYYIMVDGRWIITGSFSIYIDDVCPGSNLTPVPGQDCLDPFPVCDYTITVPNPGYSEFGNICDFDWNLSCLKHGEKESVWYLVAINAAGILSFDIKPNDWSGGCTVGSETDYDFAVWKIGGSGASATCGNLGVPIRCNYASEGVTGCSPSGNGPAALGGSCWDVSYEPEINVANGDRYLIVISNWDNTNTGFTLSFPLSTPILTSVSPGGTLQWTGTLGTNWFAKENWGGCQVPDCQIHAVVPASVVNMPVINNFNASVRNLYINAGGSLGINSGYGLMVCGNFVNYGSFNAAVNTTVTFEDTAVTAPLTTLHNQTIEGLLTVPNEFNNVTIKKPAAYKVTALNDITMSGHFNVMGGAYGGPFDATNMIHRVGGNFTIDYTAPNLASYVPGSRLEFIGTTQSYSNRGIVNGVTMQQTAPGILNLLDPGGGVPWMVLSDSGSLILNYGRIMTGTSRVVVRKRQYNAVSFGSLNSYVQGTSGLLNATLLRYLNQSGADTGTYHFPIGTPGKGFQRVSLMVTSPLPSGVNTINASFNDLTAANNTSLGAECGIAYHAFPATPLNNGYWQLQLSPAAQFSSGVYTPYLYNSSYSNPIAGWTVMHNKGNPATAANWFLEPGPGIPTCAQIISPVSAVRRVGATAVNGLMNASTVYMATAQSFLPLPVELIHFEAKAQTDFISLSWVTASEENNLGFEVQRAASLGSDFEKIGFVKGNGTTSEQHSYTFEDFDIEFNQEYFYRLRQVDFNGGTQHSRIVSAQLGKANLSLFVYYDAGTSKTNLVYALDDLSFVEIELFNAMGQRIGQVFSGQQEEGHHIFEIDNDQLGNASGIYMIRMIVNEEVHVRRTYVPGF